MNTQGALDISRSLFPRYTQWTPHSLPVRARYGVSIVKAKYELCFHRCHRRSVCNIVLHWIAVYRQSTVFFLIKVNSYIAQPLKFHVYKACAPYWFVMWICWLIWLSHCCCRAIAFTDCTYVYVSFLLVHLDTKLWPAVWQISSIIAVVVRKNAFTVYAVKGHIAMLLSESQLHVMACNTQKIVYYFINPTDQAWWKKSNLTYRYGKNLWCWRGNKGT